MTRHEHQKQKEVVYFKEKTYELVKQHFSLFPAHFQTIFHELKTCLWVQSHDSHASREALFDNLVKLAKFMSEFVISFHNINFEIVYAFHQKQNKWFNIDAEFVFNAAFNYYRECYFGLAPCEEKLYAIDRYISLLYYQYKMYSLLDPDQFKNQIEECLSGLSRFLIAEDELKAMGFALQTQPGYNPGLFAPLPIHKAKAPLSYLEFRETQCVKARDFHGALCVARQIDELLVIHAPRDSHEMVLT